ncbi:MAG TPA: VWA domain-containing protein [Verrucomicrobiae bacterium]
MDGTENIQFQTPVLIWVALGAVPCLIVFFMRVWRRKQAAMALFVPSRLFDTLLSGYSARREKVRYVLLGTAVFFGLLTLSQPRWGFTWEEVRQRGLDVVVAVDTSRSMLAPDVPPTRIERARLACIDLMRVAKTDRLGLVAFAGSAFLQCPLTFDDEAFRMSLAAVDTGVIPQGGSSMAEAVRTAMDAFKKDEDNHKVLILMTDGEDHEEGAIEAAKEAAKAGFKIYTIGVGTPNGELLSYRDERGRQEYVRDEEGNIVRSKLNENLLREIATAGNGFYLPLTGAKTMETLYEQGLAALPKSESSSRFVQRFQERYQWPLGIVIVLLIAEWLLQGVAVKNEAAGAVLVKSSKSGPRVAVLAALMFCLMTPVVSASPAGAKRSFEAGEYKAALEEYQRLLKERPNDARLHYNAGNAAYRADDLDTAVNRFNEALRTPDLNLQRDAYYNRGNVRYRQGEKSGGAEDKQQMWESAINDYERALKLNPEDADAKFNRDLVRRKLEELKKQQEQQKEQNPDDKNQDQKENRDEKQKQDQKQKQDNKQENQQNKDEQKKQDKQSQKNEEEKQQGGEKQDQAKNEDKQNTGDESKKQDKQQADQDQKKQGDDKKDGKQPEPDENGQPRMAQGNGEMTKEQAMQLLDDLKSQERALIFQPPPKDGKAKPKIFKDW